MRAGRHIGPGGTIARVVVGLWLLAEVISGHAAGGGRLGPWMRSQPRRSSRDRPVPADRGRGPSQGPRV